ncbi:CIC family chloride channel protein [Dysgonomonas sp. PFB1-18]|uniref:chloride channel protein n=1 Tax=unclassified Dysgonomonas TaxID=2630389 RepID=UPI0024764D21|nr:MULTISPECIES: chloride channel protein [unclassified Dysgonomonas]MDL2303318.1 chloride channel protein [Dysgonomonas sp. OttesenSCG-928-D17]MDH6309681.1 CIC family chloride channel protein [Dysgonomonas sp. PF1-14]MDH6339311.1 CIC family chloride channel protein [Dysgonomonas sp. PF1-16]MDH6380810.1 CIC family chloride channel protein [Dysgonomonas sp. PFB1-18]MDH6398306.1 CIC family chloride channel protein [Dysgonomonas sp. PF1-23]
MAFEKLYNNFLVWKTQHVKEKQMVLFVSFLIGVLTALAAYILKSLIHLIQHVLTSPFLTEGANYIYLVYPVVGILIAGLYVRYVVKDDISHGVTKILYAISQRKSYIKLHNMYTSIVASSITIGFGGSVGAEAPIVLTGSAIGSNLGRFFKVEQKYLMLLIGCGAAGAIAGIFKAPIAGLVFVVEVLMLDLTTFTVMPLLVTSVTAATLSYLTMGTKAMFNYAHTDVFMLERIPYVILLGIFCGLVSLYFTRAMDWFESQFRKLNYWQKFAIGASILSILIFLLPPLYGEGYDTIEALINGKKDYNGLLDNSAFFQFKDYRWTLIIFLSGVLLMKVFASSATNGAGGTGGIFAPSLFLGCISGFIFAYVLNHSELGTYVPLLPEENFALMGMAGVMAGVMHAPLTGTFLIAELTGGYELLLPLMIVSICSYFFIKLFEPHSIYSMRLAKKGELITHHKDKAVLTLMEIEKLIETNFQAIHPEMTLGDMVKVISRSSRNVFPVLDDRGRFLGIVLIDNIRNIMFRPELYNRFTVSRVMTSPPAIIVVGMTMEAVMKSFDETKAWNLPVVDENDVYLGFISKSNILDVYRGVLADNFVEE